MEHETRAAFAPDPLGDVCYAYAPGNTRDTWRNHLRPLLSPRGTAMQEAVVRKHVEKWKAHFDVCVEHASYNKNK